MVKEGNKGNLLDDNPNFLGEGFEGNLEDVKKRKKHKNVYNKSDILDNTSVSVSDETFEDSIRKDPDGYEKRRNAAWYNLPGEEAEKPSIWDDEEVSGLGLHDVNLSDSYNTGDVFDKLAAERHRSAREIEQANLSVVGVGSVVELKAAYNKSDIFGDTSVSVSDETFEDSIRKDPDGYESFRADADAFNRSVSERYKNVREIAENKASDDGFDRLAAALDRVDREIEHNLSVLGFGSIVELEAALTGLVVAAATVTIHTEDRRSALSNGDRLDAANAKIADFENMYLNADPSKDVGSQVVVEGEPIENVDMASESEWTEIDLSDSSYMSGSSYMSNSSSEAEKTKPQKINESKSSRMLRPFRLVVSVVSTVITVFAIGVQKAARNVGSALAFRRRGSYDLKKAEDTIEYVMGDGADVRYKEKDANLMSGKHESEEGMGIKELFSRHKKGTTGKSYGSENHKIIQSILKKTADLMPAGQDSELLKEFIGSLEGDAANLMSGKHESEEGMGIKELFSRYEEKDAAKPDSTSSKQDSSKDHLADQGDQKVKGESGRHVMFAENRDVVTYHLRSKPHKHGKSFTEKISSNDTDHGASR